MRMPQPIDNFNLFNKIPNKFLTHSPPSKFFNGDLQPQVLAHKDFSVASCPHEPIPGVELHLFKVNEEVKPMMHEALVKLGTSRVTEG